MPRETESPALDYIRKLYAPQDALLAAIDGMLKQKNIHMQIAPEEGKLLQLLIKMHGVKTVVEIGTLAGYSAIWMARALPEGGHLHGINKDPEHVKMAQGYFDKSDVKNRITLHAGDAHAVLPTLRGPFDMVFIDADKESYNDYLDWADANIKKGGLIIADNTFLFDTVWLDKKPGDIGAGSWNGMKRFNERLADPTRYFSTMIPTPEGMTVAIKLF